MIGEIQVFTNIRNQPTDSQVELALSEYYLINTDCIIDMVDESALPTVTTRIQYKFNVYEDQTPPFFFKANNTLAAINTLADATAHSTKIALGVFEDSHGNPVQSFNQVTGLTAVTHYFNIADIVWGENDPTDNYCRLWVLQGGHVPQPYIVDYNISQVVDVGDGGATTTLQ